MLQSLEREPSSPSSAVPSKTTGGDSIEKQEDQQQTEESVTVKRSNPHKYLLYRPTFAQLYLYLATCFKDISDSSALLLYVSADGAKKSFKGEAGLEEGTTQLYLLIFVFLS
jgi:hypothetical protein